jgi:hypothetical protein
VKAEARLDLPAYLRRWLGGHKLPGAVQLQVTWIRTAFCSDLGSEQRAVAAPGDDLMAELTLSAVIRQEDDWFVA